MYVCRMLRSAAVHNLVFALIVTSANLLYKYDIAEIWYFPAEFAARTILAAQGWILYVFGQWIAEKYRLATDECIHYWQSFCYNKGEIGKCT